MVRVPHMKSRGCRFKYFEEMNSGHLKGAGHLLVWGINNRKALIGTLATGCLIGVAIYRWPLNKGSMYINNNKLYINFSFAIFIKSLQIIIGTCLCLSSILGLGSFLFLLPSNPKSFNMSFSTTSLSNMSRRICCTDISSLRSSSYSIPVRKKNNRNV